MIKVLYISNIEVPYRSEFFNQLSEKVDLTVLYERKKSSNRDNKWSKSVGSNYKIEYLNGIKYKNEYSFSFRIIKYIFSKKYDKIIIGCFNSPSQIMAILLLRLFNKEYILNLDGEYFLEGKSLKKRIKRFLIKGASKYFVAGKQASFNLAKFVPKEKVYSYNFSSLTQKELIENAKHMNKNTNNLVLVVGQYYDYKGLDIALEVAALDNIIKYRFVGSGNRSDLLKKKVNELHLKNVEIIPFLQKEDLYKEYQNCKCLLLTSRQECWGLVINEAASFGCPIIASNGSGAARELLEEKWLIDANDNNSIYKKIIKLDLEEYNQKILIEKSSNYSIEECVKETNDILES